MPRIINHVLETNSNLNNPPIKHTHSFKAKYSQNLPLQFFSYDTPLQPSSPPHCSSSNLPSWMHNNSRPRTKPHSRGRAQWAVGKDSKRKALETGWVDLFPLSSSTSITSNTLGLLNNSQPSEYINHSSNNSNNNSNNNTHTFDPHFPRVDHRIDPFFSQHTHFAKFNNHHHNDYFESNPRDHFAEDRIYHSHETDLEEREREYHFKAPRINDIPSPSSSQPTSPENETLPNISELFGATANNSFPISKTFEKRTPRQSIPSLPSLLSKYHYTPIRSPEEYQEQEHEQHEEHHHTTTTTNTSTVLPQSGSPLDLLCECALEKEQGKKKNKSTAVTTTPILTSFKATSHSQPSTLPPLPHRLADLINVVEIALKRSSNIDQLMDFVISETKLTPPIIYKILFDHFGFKPSD